MREGLLAAWRRTVRAAPGAKALCDLAQGRWLTRREVDEAADRWADENPAAGRVRFFCEPNGPGWLAAFLGILKRGAAAAPLDPGEPDEARRRAADELERLLARLDPACAVVKLTSGSTGLPQAIPFTDSEMLADGRHICATMGIGPRDVNLGLIPFGHSYGLGNLVVPLLAQGTAIASGCPPLPHAIAAAIREARATVFPTVPPVLRAIAESELPAHALAALRLVISAGAPLEPAIARQFHARFGRLVHNFYGSTETGGIAFDRTGQATLTGRAAGRALRGVAIEWMRRGRFRVRSRAVFTLGNPAMRGRRRVGVHQPPDRGRLSPSGELVLLGRLGRIVKLAGRRLDPAEVEGVLRTVDGVRECWVGVHPSRPETLAAAVASSRAPADLRRALAGRLAPWKIPRRWTVLPELPKTLRGKSDARKLMALLAPAASAAAPEISKPA